MSKLFTQGTDRIEVIVRKESDGESTRGANEKDPENAGNNAEAEEQSETGVSAVAKSNTKSLLKVNLTKAYAASSTIARQAFNYYVSGIALETGDSAVQEATQRNLEQLEDGLNMAQSTGMGALYGSMGGGGWIGAVIGAVLGLGTSISSTVMKYKGKAREYNAKMFKERNSIEYQRARAQISFTTGRLR